MGDNEKTRVFMIVFGETKHDGRVLRAAEALSKEYDVVLAGFGDCPISHGVAISYINVNVPYWSRWLRHIIYLVKIILIGIKVRPDIVHAHDYFVAMHGWIIAKMTRAICVYDAHEYLPGIKERSRFRHWLFMLMEQIVINRYNLVISTSDERAKIIKEYYCLRDMPGVVMNIDSENNILEKSQSESEISLFGEDKWDQKFPLVVYQGVMGTKTRCLDNLITAFIGLRDRCFLIMAGDGEDLPSLKKLVKQSDLEKVILFLGRLSQNELMHVMNRATIGVIIYSNNEVNNVLCSPNKIHEYARAGLAVVASNQPPLTKMLEEHRIGELFDPEDPASIKNAIIKVLSNLEIYQADISGFRDHYNWNLEKRKLLELYKVLTNVNS